METIVNICLYGSYILIVACLAGWLFFIGRKLVTNPRSMQTMVIMVVSTVVVYFIGKLIAPDMTSHLSDAFIDNNQLDQSTYNTVSGLYFSSILGLVASALLMIGGEVYSIIRK